MNEYKKDLMILQGIYNKYLQNSELSEEEHFYSFLYYLEDACSELEKFI